MSLAIRDSDRELATAVRGRALLWRPERVADPTFKAWRALVDAELERLRIRIYNGPIADSMQARGMMLARRAILVNDGAGDWRKWDGTIYCPFFTHELRHPLEAIYLKPAGTFQAEYVFQPRSRWAKEMQGEIAVVRWRRVQEARRENVLREAEACAKRFARPFPGYNLGRIANLRRETVGLLMDVFDGRAP